MINQLKSKIMKKKTVEIIEHRKEWHEQANDVVDNLQNDIDLLELPESTVLEIEKLINKFRDDLKCEINLFEVSPQIAIETEYFVENLLDEIYYERIAIDESEVKRMTEIVTQNSFSEFVPIQSLAERMKFESFMADFSENPYQLKLIA